MESTYDFHLHNCYTGTSLKSSDKFRRRYLSSLGTPFSSSDTKQEKNEIHTTSKLVGHYQQCKSPMLQKLNRSNSKISQRKRKLFDSYEHRVHLTTTWDWTSFWFTCTIAILTLVSDYAYLHSQNFKQASTRIRRIYFFFYIFSQQTSHIFG